MPAENHTAAEIFLEYPAGVLLVEVFRAQVLRHPLDLPVGVGGLPGGCQRLFVHIGRIDLHAFAEWLPSHGLREEDRHRVAFLARSATGAPDAKIAAVRG